MRSLLVAATLSASLSLAAVLPVSADEAKLPNIHEIYQQEEAGHYTQAQQMISEVLKAKPDSAKAHFVQAELFARQNQTAQARAELATAERLDPKEEFASARAVQELKAQVNGERRALPARVVHEEQRSAVSFPWKTLLIIVVAVALLMMVFRRRTPPAQYPMGGGGPGAGGPGGYGPPPGYGPGYGGPAQGGGMGSGIAGGLASGLAVGAGVVAGEQLAHHFLDGDRDRASGGFIPSAEAGDNPNSDMGGNDFGASDPGSWDDGGGGGGGGDDWS